MEVQGRLMQARYIEIHEVCAKKKIGYFCNKVVYQYLILETV